MYLVTYFVTNFVSFSVRKYSHFSSPYLVMYLVIYFVTFLVKSHVLLYWRSIIGATKYGTYLDYLLMQFYGDFRFNLALVVSSLIINISCPLLSFGAECPSLTLKQHLSLDSLRSIHKDCKTTFKAPLVQLINKEVSGGRPEAVSLRWSFCFAQCWSSEWRDGRWTEPDPSVRLPRDQQRLCEGWSHHAEWLWTQAYSDQGRSSSAHLSGPLTGPSVEKLEMISPRSLQLWGIRFPEEEEVTFSARATTANLDATIIARDQVIAEVGQTDPQDPQPTERKRRKLIQCPICRPSRTFTDEEKLAQHLSVFHVFD